MILTESDLAMLETLRRLDANRPPPPWVYFGEALMGSVAVSEEVKIIGVGDDWCTSLDFIAACGTHLPRLLEIVDELRKGRDASSST